MKTLEEELEHALLIYMCYKSLLCFTNKVGYNRLVLAFAIVNNICQSS